MRVFDLIWLRRRIRKLQSLLCEAMQLLAFVISQTRWTFKVNHNRNRRTLSSQLLQCTFTVGTFNDFYSSVLLPYKLNRMRQDTNVDYFTKGLDFPTRPRQKPWEYMNENNRLTGLDSKTRNPDTKCNASHYVTSFTSLQIYKCIKLE
jgi:hypothetical protein